MNPGFVFKSTVFADVDYRDITSEGLLRQSSFKGLWIAAGRADRLDSGNSARPDNVDGNPVTGA